jgi:prephenate dehydrogenase
MFDTIAIVGVGLIGASIGMAVRKRQLARRVVGIGRTRATLETAQHRGAIDQHFTDLAAGVRGADFVILCTPVERIAEQAVAAIKAAPRALVTDAGSTKEGIVAAVEQAAPPGALFVGSHPLAGSEKTGPEAARADLLVGRVVVLTPTPRTPDSALSRVHEFWQQLGARTLEMSPAEHDAAVAITSHLPHLAASALAAATPARLLDLVAGGWLDSTRIAAGDAQLWRQILLANRDHSLRAMDEFEKVFAQLRRALAEQDGDALCRILEAGKQIRDAVGS